MQRQTLVWFIFSINNYFLSGGRKAKTRKDGNRPTITEFICLTTKALLSTTK